MVQQTSMRPQAITPEQTRRVLCDPSLSAVRDARFARLQALFDGEPLEHAFVLCGISGAGRVDPYQEPERWVQGALDHLAEHAGRLRDPAVFRPLVVEFCPYGVHYVDRMLGAQVFELREPGNWQARYLTTPVGELQPPDLDRDETWQLSQRAAQAFLQAEVTVPLLGLPTIASALNIAVNLYGQEMLAALRTDPEAARRDLRVINDLLARLHRWYLEHIPLQQLQPVVAAFRTQPPGFGQLCGCTCQLLSPALYREVIAPLDEELLSVYPHGGMIHLCGAHTQHIPTWREMRALRALQLNDRAAEDLASYFRELRADQMLYVTPCAAMPVEQIMAITGGRRVVIVADIDPPLRILS